MSWRRLLPARAQDVARSVVDLVSPGRRRAIRARRSDATAGRAHILTISPTAQVLSGPFTGMRMAPEASWGGMAARLVGSYEQEIADDVAAIIESAPSRVLDIGAAEGYYAVGLARALPETGVFAFDIDPEARRLCRAAARLNGVTNIHVGGRMDHSLLRKHVTPGCWVICDCEGFEAELLDPDRVPELRRANLLVELHEFAHPGVTRLILDRFATTHGTTVVNARPRRARDYPALAHLSVAEAEAAVDEGRPAQPRPMQWAVMKAQTLDASASQ